MSIEKPEEHCICAAVKLPDGIVICGLRHDNCILTIVKLGRDAHNCPQGFLTSYGRFVSREEGMHVQRLAGKPSYYSADGKLIGKILFSEDLY